MKGKRFQNPQVQGSGLSVLGSFASGGFSGSEVLKFKTTLNPEP
jgi:hypothetical protein